VGLIDSVWSRDIDVVWSRVMIDVVWSRGVDVVWSRGVTEVVWSRGIDVVWSRGIDVMWSHGVTEVVWSRGMIDVMWSRGIDVAWSRGVDVVWSRGVDVVWSRDQASGAGFTLQLSEYNDRFRISPTNGTQTVTASIIVANSTLLDVDYGQEYYSFLVCSHHRISQSINQSINP